MVTALSVLAADVDRHEFSVVMTDVVDRPVLLLPQVHCVVSLHSERYHFTFSVLADWDNHHPLPPPGGAD